MMADKFIPNDVMKMILNYYLDDYSWMNFALGQHKAPSSHRGLGYETQTCETKTCCTYPCHHNFQSAIDNILALPMLKTVSKFWNSYITKWFINTWKVKHWKYLPHLQYMCADKCTKKNTAERFFRNIFKKVNVRETIFINQNLSTYVMQLKYVDKRLQLHCKHIIDMKHKASFYVEQDNNAEFGWRMKTINSVNDHLFDYSNLQHCFDICDIMSLLHLPNVNNMIDPQKFDQGASYYFNVDCFDQYSDEDLDVPVDPENIYEYL
jgi:hypothetical protein